MNNLFYYCPICGNIVMMVEGKNSIMCCGKNMELLEGNVIDASLEKHVPVYEIMNDSLVVKVGEIVHPMIEEHYISWISLVSGDEIIIKRLNPGDKPEVSFPYIRNSIIYAYCNIHGLWKNKVK